jgi:tRNA nucleotidyltransferase (CCA-adding enzyme)
VDAASPSSEFRHTKLRHFGVLEMISKRLPESVQDVLKKASQIAEERSERVFLVGGIVRDLILDYENHDVDLVVIGEGIEFAHEFSKLLGGYAHPHEQFGTSVIVLPDGFRVDVVTARRESYAYPGALPEVSSGSLRADLYRRDFTINALAIDLTPRFYGHIVDYFGGMRDIQNRNIRILHGLSFIDDPTRMLRAVRFSVRLNFRLSEGTRLMLESAVRKNMLKRVSGKRIQSEMVHLLEGPRPLSSLEQLHALGLLNNIHRKIRLDRFTMELLQNISRTVGWFKITFPEEKPRIFMLYYMALFEKLTYNERRSLCRRLITATRESKPLLQYKQQVKRAVHLFRKERTPLPSRVTELFDNFSIETILYTHAFAHSHKLKKAIADYLTDYRHQRLDISGRYLEKLGLEKGPVFGTILKEIRSAKLDGKLKTRKQQQTMARELADKYREKLTREE